MTTIVILTLVILTALTTSWALLERNARLGAEEQRDYLDGVVRELKSWLIAKRAGGPRGW